MKPRQRLRADGFIFDLDGTIYLGDAALPGAVECVRELRRRGKKIIFVSNKPLAPRADYAAKLTRLGIPTRETEIVTSAFVLARHLATTMPGLMLYVFGEEYLIAELKTHGLKVAPEFCDQDPKELIDPEGIDAVVVAFDRTLNYRKLNTAYQALCRGARFFATNADKTCPMPGGAIPDAGAIIAALEHITGRKLELLAGKPSALMMQVAANELGLPPQRCLITGDRLETDIRMGQDAGMQTAVILTGVSTREQAERMSVPPDLILERLDELIELTE
ncbi:MAG: HAD-IIA family hydrolase [Anaerolineales bacterium]|nr:HAD-IIA family hydrolase [Anaerolineales bacterium]